MDQSNIVPLANESTVRDKNSISSGSSVPKPVSPHVHSPAAVNNPLPVTKPARVHSPAAVNNPLPVTKPTRVHSPVAVNDPLPVTKPACAAAVNDPLLVTKPETTESVSGDFQSLTGNSVSSTTFKAVNSKSISQGNSKSVMSTSDDPASSDSCVIPPWRPSFREKFNSPSNSTTQSCKAASSSHNSYRSDDALSSGHPLLMSGTARSSENDSWRTSSAHSSSHSWRSGKTGYSGAYRRGTYSSDSSCSWRDESRDKDSWKTNRSDSRWWRRSENESSVPAVISESHGTVSYPSSQSLNVKKYQEAKEEKRSTVSGMIAQAPSFSLRENASQIHSSSHKQGYEAKYPRTERDRSWIVKKFSRDELEHFVSLDSIDLLALIRKNLKRFLRTLEVQQIQNTREFDLVLNIFFKLAECVTEPTGQEACKVIAESLSERCARFLLQLRLYCTSDFSRVNGCTCYPVHRVNLSIQNQYTFTECRVYSLCTLFEKVLDTMPSVARRVLPISDFLNNIKTRKAVTNSDVLHAVESLEMVHKETTNKPVAISQEELNSRSWDNSEYRSMSIFPNRDELCTPDRPAKLRRSIINGRYKDWIHYYDVQFRLLREDFTAPLRRGIYGYTQGLRGRDLRDVRIYRNTTIVEPVISKNGVNFEVMFDNVHLKNCNWSHSSRLLYGSLLCLSCDGFNQIIFAVVANRDERELSDGRVTLDFVNDIPMEYCTKGLKFVMIESSAYFEASRHVMASLQTAEIETMPFTQYLIANECGAVALPHYLQQKESAFYDISCLSTEEFDKGHNKLGNLLRERLLGKRSTESLSSSSSEDEDQITGSSNTINILDDQSWCLEDTHLDPSQMKALKMALTQEVSLIQGPPGTGKTYMGIKIVEILLANKNQWKNEENSPILVMCYTNHALDQFLEGILEAKQTKSANIIRVGKRSKNEKMSQFNIAQKRKNVYLPIEVLITRRENESDFYEKKSLLEDRLDLYHKASKSNTFIPLESIKCVIGPDHLYQLQDLAKTPEEEEMVLEMWLGLWKRQETHDCANIVSQHNKKDNSKPSEPVSPPVRIEAATYPDSVQLNKGMSESIPPETSEQSTLDNHSSESGGNKQPNVYFLDEVQSKVELTLEGSSSNDNCEEPSGSFTADTREIHQNDSSTALIDFQGEGTLANDARIVDDESDNENEIELGIPGVADEEPPKTMAADENIKATLIKVDNYEQIIVIGLLQKELNDTEVHDIQNLGNIDMQTRWKLYNYWRALLTTYIAADCEEMIAEFNECCKTVNEYQKRADRFTLETADIIGMTTTGVAKYQHILHMVKPRIVIVEEAAEVLESHIVSALNAGTQHLILIGDHKQLKPKPNEFHLAKNYNMDVSLFERLIRNEFPYATLNIQHRMRPEIADLVRPLIYRDLQDHKSVQEYEQIKGVQKNMFFIQHQHKETKNENLLSYSNEHEARYLVSLCRYLLQQGYQSSQITILVTYTGQFLEVRSLMPRNIFNGIILRTVDNYQGEENDIVLLSLVRSNEEGDIGFLKEENRVCVSISRAKKGFYCIGNFTMLAGKSLRWEKLLERLHRNEFIGEQLTLYCACHPATSFSARVPSDFEKMAPEGGCQLDCQFRLNCGHVCVKKCHIRDPSHLEYRCTKPCTKKCPNGHNCPSPCYLLCKKCMKTVIRTLPECGHQKKMFCYQSPTDVCCELPCENTCPQGHNCPLLCHQKCAKCVVKLSKLLPKCQHISMVPCHQDPSTFLCEEDCYRLCQYGHPCPKKCHEECGLCTVNIEKTIPECSHTVLLPCWKAPVHENCTMACSKLLGCGHKCQAKCGEPCTFLCKETISKLLDCRHDMEVLCFKSENDYALHLCNQRCKRLLPCKHPCQNLCHESCTTKCTITVNKVWPCGHKLKRKCFQTKNPELYPCKSKCRRILSCGHPCTEKCGSPCTPNCGHEIPKILPCGHTKSLPCHADVKNTKCEILCKVALACGHRCSGQCGDCSSKRLHQLCKHGFDLQRFCGHRGSVQCVDMRDVHPGRKEKHLAHCIHWSCTHNCSLVCLPCEEPCPWECPHYSCPKLCHEFCDRPACNERCSQILKCGHQCPGVCGEPCFTLCPECQPREFTKLLTKQTYEGDQQYVQLNCKHVFTLEFMDKYILRYSLSEVVAPVCCPKCHEPLSCNNYRYGNICKQHILDKNGVQEKIDMLSNQHVGEEKVFEFRSRFKTSFSNLKSVFKRIQSTLHTEQNSMISKKHLIAVKRLISVNITGIQAQEAFLYHILVNILELFNEDEKHPITLDFITHAWTYMRTVLELFENKSRLSIQVIHDLSSELYRLSLMQQTNLVKSSLLLSDSRAEDKHHDYAQSTINPSKIMFVDEWLKELELNPSMRVDVTQYTEYSTLLREAITEHSPPAFFINSERLVRDVKESTPRTLKGIWRKCSLGHFYCTPLTTGEKEYSSDCQECSRQS